MNLSKRLQLIALSCVLGLGALEMGERLSVPGIHSFVSAAHAVVGRPLSPVSVAGVARRN